MNILGGYGARGREEREAGKIIADAKSVDGAGAFCIVVEGVMEEIANDITRNVTAPVIGIGASADCDGQVLVTDDMDELPESYRRYLVNALRRDLNLGAVPLRLNFRGRSNPFDRDRR